MFYYIDQPRTPSFPIRLVKTEPDVVVKSVDIGLRRWTLVIAVISVDAYPFLAFSDLNYHLKVFSGCTELPDGKETELESSD